jgi:hypothetical protein
MQQNRAQETPETRTNRRISNREKCNKTEHKNLQKHVLTAAFQIREKMQENRAQETPETSATRRISTRIRNRKARAQETAENVLTVAF